MGMLNPQLTPVPGMIGGYPPVLPPLQGPVDGIVSMGSMQPLHPGVLPPHQLPPGMPGIPPPGVIGQNVSSMVGAPAPGVHLDSRWVSLALRPGQQAPPAPYPALVSGTRPFQRRRDVHLKRARKPPSYTLVEDKGPYNNGGCTVNMRLDVERYSGNIRQAYNIEKCLTFDTNI
uniref:Uncharacterized protein n=1 Tax=Sphaerodactylus townsendi TaxID=933632 RepID=A0ACB8EHR0_9SAUR